MLVFLPGTVFSKAVALTLTTIALCRCTRCSPDTVGLPCRVYDVTDPKRFNCTICPDRPPQSLTTGAPTHTDNPCLADSTIP